MISRHITAVRSVFSRFLVGVTGTWLIVGPIVLLIGSNHGGMALFLWLSLLLLYSLVLAKCLRRGWETLQELVSETGLALSFIIIGSLLQQIVGISSAVQPDRAIVYMFIGFFVAELTTQPKAPFGLLAKKISALLSYLR